MSTNRSLKKTLLVVGLTGPACVMAYTSHPALNGYYAGINIGSMRTESKFSDSAVSEFSNRGSSVNFLELSQRGVQVHTDSGAGALLLGYSHYFNNSNFYWAGEIFVNWANRKNILNNEEFYAEPGDDLDSEIFTTSAGVRLQKTEFGLDFRPGYLFDTKTMVYGRIGVAFNKIKSTMDSDFTFFDAGPFALIYENPITASKSKSMAGLRLGIGFEQPLTDSLSITADYIFTYYGKAHASGVTDTVTRGGEDVFDVTNPDGLSVSSSGRISNTQAGMFGIRYYFYPVS